jgi:hypothetical protein
MDHEGLGSVSGPLDTSMRHRIATSSAMVRRWHGGAAVVGCG